MPHRSPARSGRYYRRGLYLGAAVLSLALAAAAALEVRIRLHDALDERRHRFAIQREQVQSAADRLGERTRQFIDFYEEAQTLHDADHLPVDAYRLELQRRHGAIVTDDALTRTPFSLVTTLTAAGDAARLGALLRLVRAASPAPAVRQRNTDTRLYGFIYTPEADFFAASPPLRADELQRLRTPALHDGITQRTAAIEAALAARPPSYLRRQRVVWLPPQTDAASGEPSLYVAAALFRDARRFAVMVSRVPTADFAALFLQGPRLPGFFVVSRDLRPVFGAPPRLNAGPDAASSTQSQTMSAALAQADARLRLSRAGSTLLLTQRISGPDWIAVYAFDRRALLADARADLAPPLLACAVLLALLWSFVLLFDRRVLTPLQAHAQRVFDSEAFNRTVVETAPVGLVVLDAGSGDVIMQNDIAAALVGDLPQLGVPFYRTLLARAAAAATVRSHAPLEFEFAPARTDGSTLDLDAAFARARYQNRDVVLFGLTDAGPHKQAQRLLHAARHSAEQASQAKSMFVAAISHEIRTPLHGALGNLELLDLDTLTPTQRERVATIRHSFDALLTLVNDALDLSKIEAHELRIADEPFDLVDVVERCAQTFAPLLTGRGLRFHCLVDPALDPADGVSLHGDAHRVAQVLMNLVGNAGKFTAAGTVTLCAERLPTDGSDRYRIRLRVADTGIGIPPERQSALFEPFAQADGTIARRFGGTGLGLSLCKRLAELMGGSITVDSRPGAGSTFTVELPFKTTVACAGAPMPPARRLDGRRVVVACTAPAWRRVLVERIARWGAAVSAPSHGDPQHLATDGEAVLVVASDDPLSEPTVDAVGGDWQEIVVVSPHGPLHPQRRGGALRVSAFSSDALTRALDVGAGVDVGAVASQPVAVALQWETPRRAALLVAEDDAVNRTLIRHQLDKLGYRNVETVENGAQAFARWRAAHFDLVLTDFGMPGMSGPDLLAAIRAQGGTTPVVALTASSPQQTDAAVPGFAAILHKPTTLAQLHAALDAALDGAPGAHASAASAEAPDAAQQALAAELTAIFAQSWPPDRAALRQALAAGDRGRLQRRLHRVRGALAILRATELCAACDALEKRCARDDLECLAEALLHFIAAADALAARAQAGAPADC